MTRQVRLEYAGAVYHVMARGNQGRRIYADHPDRKRWLKTLAEGCEQQKLALRGKCRPRALTRRDWSPFLTGR